MTLSVISSQSSAETGAKTMNKKILIWQLATIFLITASIAEAQPVKKVPRIGFLVAGSSGMKEKMFELRSDRFGRDWLKVDFAKNDRCSKRTKGLRRWSC